MKFIFDFDDVLVNTSKNPGNFRECIYTALEKAGVSSDLSKKYIEKERFNQFSLRKMLAHFSVKENLYEEIIKINQNLVDEKLLKIVRKIGKDNCFIVTYGDVDYQKDKVKNAGIANLFSEIIAVSGTKKDAVEKICAKFPDQKVIFIDDKVKHFEDLDFKKYSNLQTILYDEKGLEKLKALI